MPRKRKVPVVNEENVDPQEKLVTVTKKSEKPNKKQKREPEWATGDGLNVIKVILSIQKSDCNANKCTSELTKLYRKMDHNTFMTSFNIMTRLFLNRDENDEIATRVLRFVGSFVASFGEEVDETTRETHPIIQDLLKEILELSSNTVHVRARLCSLVTHIMSSFSQKAELDETIIDKITERMLYFMKDVSPGVRAQAVLALQRLQDPDNPDDVVTRAYMYHMESDPVSKVRQATITAIAKKIQNMQSLIERLHDVDEKVRRHTYLQMATFSVKSYKIVDRITILDTGLNDRSDMVKKAVVNILLANWIGVYDYDYAELIRAIKIDSCEKELVKFRKLADQTLTEVFKKRKLSDMIAYLDLPANKEFKNCLTLEKTTLEMLLVWKAVAKFHQDYMEGRSGNGIRDLQEDSDDEEEQNRNETMSNVEIMPELSIFCDYMTKVVSDFKLASEDPKLSKIYFSQCIVVLLEIVQMNDLGDEIGKERLQELLKKILLEYEISEFAISEIARVMNQIIPNADARLQFFNSIVNETVKIGAPSEDRRQLIINDLINKSDIDRKTQAKGITLKLMELKEQETVFVERKQYAECQRVQEEAEQLNTELIELLKPVAEAESVESVHQLALLERLSSTTVKKLTPAETLKNLRICYYAITSKNIRQITHDVLSIYNEFVRFHLESNDIMIRIWALKTATAYSLLYESIAKDVFYILKSQIFRHAHVLIWECAIDCIVDLLLRYSIEKMDNFNNLDGTNVSVTGVPSSGLINCSQNRSRRGGRTLYTDADVDEEDEFDEGNFVKNLDIMQMLLHVVEQNVDKRIYKVTIVGICKLILHGVYCTRDIIAKFLIMYFNPVTDAEISQILGVFLENIVRKKKQEFLHDALQPTIVTLFEAPHDSPLREVKLDTVLKYIVGATRPIFCSNGLNLHNTLAMKFLEFMQENNEAKDILKIFSKELIDLEIGEDPLLKKDITKKVDALLKDASADQRTKKYLTDFRSMLNGTYKVPLKFSSTARVSTAIPEEDEVLENIEEENEEEAAAEEKPQEQSIKELKEDSPELDATPANVSTNLSPSKRKLLDVSVKTPKIKKDETLDNETLTEDVEIPASPEHLELPATQVMHLEMPATQQLEATKVESEEEEDVTVISSDDEIPATPVTPVTVKPKRQRAAQEQPQTPTSTRAKPTAKRVLEISHTTPATPSVSSPIRKARKSVTPSTSQLQTSTPKAPASESRMTRKQAQEELALHTTMTRSASKSFKSTRVSVEITSKAVEVKKAPAKAPAKVEVKKAPPKVEPKKAPAKEPVKSKLPVKKATATTSKPQTESIATSRPTRTRAGDSQSSQAKKTSQQPPARPRWK